MSEIGDNSGVAADILRQFIERAERLQEEIDGINGDKADVFAEAKGQGFDTKAMKAIIKIRRKDPAERQEEEAIVDLYKRALGMA